MCARPRPSSKASGGPDAGETRRPVVVLGLLGPTLDRGGRNRWERWRPTVDICRHEDFVIDRLELLTQPEVTDAQRSTATGKRRAHRARSLAEEVVADIREVSPETEVRCHPTHFEDPWDFEAVYAILLDFVRAQSFSPEDEDYLVHITTGTHVAQICWFLLTETRELPAKLLQSSPPDTRLGKERSDPGTVRIIDLDLSRYDQIASRFAARTAEDLSFLKAGIETRNARFNALIERIERVVLASRAPILLTGPTGTGKTRLARRIYELARDRRSLGRIAGRFVEVNCATLRGDAAMSALFGHEKGAFTGATSRRDGLLLAADGGLLFLDEIGELGLDEQAMLLRAIEDRRFMPLGSERERESDFQLIAGTNRDLRAEVARGRFREDLLARIDLWTFALPALRERPEDIEPNLDYELDRWRERGRGRVSFNREARARFLAFARSEAATWPGNFRDFSAAVERMATLAEGGRIDEALVEEELERLRRQWRRPDPAAAATSGSGSGTPTPSSGPAPGPQPRAGQTATLDLADFLDAEALEQLDRFDRVQLTDVIGLCRASATASAAGRALFSASRARRRSVNDADRLRKYLARFGLSFRYIKAR
ncbi:sigma-54 dependent transcriptional regulator RtcR [Plesiocystis pacifica SIR-1]|uniref:Sigma-54 dependent transcriptional regulator RtcR n=1 Tax=Plesiocystis pacifica SIR-1 TaxID=391625 RepID=A6GBW9_9BACT|nr:RNA repair transcriptional activator RtcR [Plesiocystis pacifica]EDM76642.1 sigma-54 dependent transcriptional regulator RtcR [Plesiocystis pacifica SIR-1]